MANIERLIVGRILGENSETENLKLSTWLDESDDNRAIYSQFLSVWEKSEGLQPFFEIDKCNDFDTIWSCIQKKRAKGAKQFVLSQFVLRVAAVLLPIIMVSSLLHFYVPGFGRWQKVVADQVMTIKLPDSSVVDLNKGASITYLVQQNADIRFVKMHGEAFFSVAKDSLHPFIIESVSSKIEVLGTSFLVKEQNNSRYFKVSVVEGHVAITNNNHTYSLLAGDQLEINNKKGVVEKNNSTNFLFWKTGQLTFKNAGLNEIVEDLKEAYEEIDDVRIFGAASDVQVTTAFKNASVNEVLEELSFHFGKKTNLKDKTLIISD